MQLKTNNICQLLLLFKYRNMELAFVNWWQLTSSDDGMYYFNCPRVTLSSYGIIKTTSIDSLIRMMPDFSSMKGEQSTPKNWYPKVDILESKYVQEMVNEFESKVQPQTNIPFEGDKEEQSNTTQVYSLKHDEDHHIREKGENEEEKRKRMFIKRILQWKILNKYQLSNQVKI